MFTNARGLVNKMRELDRLIHKENFREFVGVAETWFDRSHDWLAAVKGYSLYWKDRVGRGREGCACTLRMI